MSLYPSRPLTTGAPHVTLASTSARAALAADAPSGSRRRLVLVMAVATTLAEIASIGGWLPLIPVATLHIPLSFLPALGLAAVCGERLLGRSASRRRAVVYWVFVGAALAITAGLYIRSGHAALWVGLVGASANEELVYRLAIPAVIAAVLRLGRVRVDVARITSLALAGLWFVLLPGHREQMGSVAGALPFVAFAALAAFVVYRSGSILPMAAGHAISNLLTFLVWGDAATTDARSMGVAFVLCLLVLAYGRPRRITVGDNGGLLDTRTGLEVAVIDLRDGHPASVTLTDGRTIPIEGALANTRAVPARTV